MIGWALPQALVVLYRDSISEGVTHVNMPESEMHKTGGHFLLVRTNRIMGDG